MGKGWRHFLDDEKQDRYRKFEKIRKGKRSVRGREEDDWLLPQSADVSSFLSQGMRRGRVIEAHKRHIFVAEENESGLPDTQLLWLCTVAKRHFQRAHKERNFVVVGDRILFEADAQQSLDEEGEPVGTDLPRGVIQHAFERTSKISRRDPINPEWEHVMLANIDHILIVASVLNPQVRWGLIDRLLVQAELAHIPVSLVLNKIDLLDDPSLAKPEFKEQYQRRVQIYRQLGYEVLEISALYPKRTASVVTSIKKLFKGKVVGLSGHSGVGKSSLINLLQPEMEREVDENPEIFYKGRHTTTYNSLLHLKLGGYAIDTPGVRSFALHDIEPIELSHCFREFRPFKCKYRECAHLEEDDCAVKAAVASGHISPERYRSYVGILQGTTGREGDGDESEADLIADMQARQQSIDEDPER